MRTTLVLLICGLVFSTPALSDEMNPDESAVWQLEEAYYKYAKANDPESYLTLFDENVIGWPTMDNAPKGKEKVSQWIAAVHADPSETWNYELKRHEIISFDDVVVVHYLLREFAVSAETGKEIRSDTFRISHTWQRHGDSWQIISGMGGVQN